MTNERMVSLKYILEHIPVCRATVYNWVNEGRFPQYRKIGRRTVWLLSEVNEFMQAGTATNVQSEAGQDNRPNPA